MHSSSPLNLINKYRGCIMGAAALWIWSFHVWVPVLDWVPAIGKMEAFITRIGFAGVDIFFFLSGMGMVYAISKHSTMEFYKRRFSRTYLPFFLTGLIRMFYEDWTLVSFLKNVSGYRFYGVYMYIFLWFVPAIMTLYLLFPLFYRFFKKAPNKGLFLYTVLTVWLFLSVALEHTLREDLYGLTNRIPVFLVGVLAGWTVKEGDLAFTKQTWAACLATFLLGLYFAFKTNYQEMYLLVPSSNCCVPNFLIAVSGTCLLAKLFSLLDGWNCRLSKGILKFLGFYGSISLEFYCLQEWLCDILMPKLPVGLSPAVIDIIKLTACTLAAFLLAKLCGLVRKSLGLLSAKKAMAVK